MEKLRLIADDAGKALRTLKEITLEIIKGISESERRDNM